VPVAIGTKILSLAGLLETALDACDMIVGESELEAEVMVPVGNGTTVSCPLEGSAVLMD
jgi:hypothetical protein